MNEEEQDIELDKENLDPTPEQARYGAGDSELVEEYAGDVVKKIKEKLKSAEDKAKEYLDGWQRAQADFVNIRKRDEEAKMEFLKFAHADVVSQLIPVLDSFELSLPHGNKELEVIYKQFISILKSGGLEEVDPKGEIFDPRKHESVGVAPTPLEEEDDKILEVLQKGYMINGKIIRPAKVRIGEYKG